MQLTQLSGLALRYAVPCCSDQTAVILSTGHTPSVRMLTASSAVMVVPSTSQCRAHRQRCPRRGRGRSPGPIRCDTQLRLRLASTELILNLLYMIYLFQIMVVEYFECVSLKSGVDVAFLGIYRQSWLGGRHKFAAVPGGESVLLAAQMLCIARLFGMVTKIIVGLNRCSH